MKTILLLALTALIGTGCVMTPTGDFYGGAVEGDYSPRVYTGSRSSVTVWLHPTYVVADAYPIAQAHCSRWGFYARPTYDWSISASIERRLDYSCVRYRPVLSGPHIIIGSPFYRSHYRHWHGRSHYRSPHRRRHYGRDGYDRPVYTPKPVPRHYPKYRAPRRRGTFGRRRSPKDTRLQRRKPWEHNRAKNQPIGNPGRGTTVQRGKPWEHNRSKNKKNLPRLKLPTKRSTFGGVLKPKKTIPRGSVFKNKVKTKRKTVKTFGKIRPKNSSRRVRKGPLTL